MRVFEDRSDHSRGRRIAWTVRIVDTGALATVPTVIDAWLPIVDFLALVLSYIVDEETHTGVVRIHGETERIAQPPRIRFLTVIAGGRPAVGVAASGLRSLK